MTTIHKSEEAEKDVEKVAESSLSSDTQDSVVCTRLVRKLDLRIFPSLCFMYLLSYLDRGNIGNAKIVGLDEDLGMSSIQYQTCLSIFYVGYVLGEIPSNIVMRRWKPSVWLAIIMIAWGTIGACMAAVQNFAGLATTRILLGFAEAGFFPGVIYYLSLFYPRKEMARRVGLFWSFGSMAGAFGGLLAGAITQIQHTLRPWQWLFVLEGVPTILAAFWCLFYLPDSPESAKFLSVEEREYAVRRMREDAGVAHDHSWTWAHFWSVFTDWKVYAYMLMYITGTSALQGVTLFLPSIIRDLGQFTSTKAQLLTVPPYIAGFIFTLIISWSSDRLLERGYHMLLTNAFILTGFFILMFSDHGLVGLRLFGAILVTAGTYANVPPKVSWFNNNFAGLSRRAVAAAAIVSVGTIGGAIGGQIYYDPPNYFNGNLISVVLVSIQTVVVILVKFALARENRRKRSMSEEEKQKALARFGDSDLAGDRHPDYMYTL
ncbi:uncharacterized protein VTP21DRAFT_735 [Calcarisporiella thermophila]|uniref:uncharacterized protein n=1 Tax=Calcarisporiella thermophila TaxID=911321 RepID=UPI0037428307